MTFDEWIALDERNASCLVAAWRAGARYMFLRLSDLGYIDGTYTALAEEEIGNLMENRK